MPSALLGVSEVTAGDVWAVGQWQLDGSRHFKALAEHWNGSAWQIVPTPDVPGASTVSLSSVSADRSNDVWAAGAWGVDAYSSHGGLLEHWNGSTWSIVHDLVPQRPGFPDSARSTSVVALTPSSVYVAWTRENSYTPNIGGVEHWDGAHWSNVSPPVRSGDVVVQYLTLGYAAGQLWVGGLYGDNSGREWPLLEYRDSAGWHRITDPSLAQAGNMVTTLRALGRNDVWLGGRTADYATPLLGHWNGSRFGATPGAHLPDAYNRPSSVTVAGFASGYGGLRWVGGWIPSTSGAYALSERWDGSTWVLESLPPLSAGYVGLANAVTADASRVLIVGAENEYPPPNSGYRPPDDITIYTLASSAASQEWTLSRAASVQKPGVTALFGMAGSSASDIWSVGLWQDVWDPLEMTGLVQHWNGATWTSVQPYDLPSPLFGVAAAATNDVWAVGGNPWTSTVNDSVAFAHWNGATWQSVSVPGGGVLESVAATGPANAWATGYQQSYVGNPTPHYQLRTIAYQWNGVQWKSVATPAATGGDVLNSVSTVAQVDAWAAGTSIDSSGRDHALIERWNGINWTVQPSLDVPGALGTDLYSIDAVSDSNVWAVGEYADSASTVRTLAEHWDGQQWSIVPSSDGRHAGLSFLASVQASPAGAVYAAGVSPTGSYPAPFFGLIDRISNGQLVSAPVQDGTDGTSYFTAMSIIGQAPYAAGYSGSGQPLVESSKNCPPGT